MRKLFVALALLLIPMLFVGALAEGILPVLQTPPPEIIEVISYHRAMNKDSTPSASTTDDGGYLYEYSSVTYKDYLDFGRALAQEGFALSQITPVDDGTGAVDVCVTKDTATLEILYNEDRQSMKVSYSPRVLALEVDPEHPYEIDASQVSILPELEQVISLHAVTGCSYSSFDFVSDGGGYRYHYYDVPYAAYARFSVKLGEAGFTLVSTEKTEDGYDRAVVTDGKFQLTVDYHQEDRDLYVYYPEFAHARARDYFGDFDPVRDGDTLELVENVKVTFKGWEFVDRFYSSNIGSHSNEDGTKQVLIHMDIDFYRPENWDISNLLRNRTLFIGDTSVSDAMTFGEYKYDPESSDLNKLYGNSYTGRAQFSAAIALVLTEEQAAHPEDIAVTFFSADYVTPYIYRLQAPEA